MSLCCSSGAMGSDDDIVVAPARQREHSEAAARSSCGIAPSAMGAGTGSRRQVAGPFRLRPMTTKKKWVQTKSYVFKHEHCRAYSLQVTGQSASSGHVESVTRHFCVVFVREAKEGAKRRTTENFKFFKRPFRPDNYVAHHKSAHAVHWTEYRELPDGEKDD